MRDWSLAFLAGMGSAVLLAGALYFELVMGLLPCELCLWQRWPHGAAVALGVLVWAAPLAPVFLAGAAAAATSGVIGVYHTGVERGWFEGPAACSGGIDVGRLSAEELLDRILAAPVVRCDEVPWEMLGLSMASWNAVASFGLAGLWLVAMRRR
ncbi:MAG: disulfide bond formation protein B [Pararhodobacter sp.]|nr:disulfide bond formation protein B [Pararhodobacter sp.]